MGKVSGMKSSQRKAAMANMNNGGHGLSSTKLRDKGISVSELSSEKIKMFHIPKEPEGYDVKAKKTVIIKDPKLIKTQNNRFAIMGKSPITDIKVQRFLKNPTGN